jgi:mRNA interferase MazF
MGVVENARRFDVYLLDLDPTLAATIQEARPCPFISPDKMT